MCSEVERINVVKISTFSKKQDLQAQYNNCKKKRLVTFSRDIRRNEPETFK